MALYLKKVSISDFNQCHKISIPYLFEKTFFSRIFFRVKKICLMLTWSKEEFMWFRLIYQEYNFGIVINKIYVPFQMWQIVFYKQKLANFLSQTASNICLYPFHFSSYHRINSFKNYNGNTYISTIGFHFICRNHKLFSEHKMS